MNRRSMFGWLAGLPFLGFLGKAQAEPQNIVIGAKSAYATTTAGHAIVFKHNPPEPSPKVHVCPKHPERTEVIQPGLAGCKAFRAGRLYVMPEEYDRPFIVVCNTCVHELLDRHPGEVTVLTGSGEGLPR